MSLSDSKVLLWGLLAFRRLVVATAVVQVSLVAFRWVKYIHSPIFIWFCHGHWSKGRQLRRKHIQGLRYMLQVSYVTNNNISVTMTSCKGSWVKNQNVGHFAKCSWGSCLHIYLAVIIRVYVQFSWRDGRWQIKHWASFSSCALTLVTLTLSNSTLMPLQFWRASTQGFNILSFAYISFRAVYNHWLFCIYKLLRLMILCLFQYSFTSQNRSKVKMWPKIFARSRI